MLKIFTGNDSNPEFIELQVASFRKYLQEDFEFVIFNCNEAITKTPEKSKEVSRICRTLGIPIIEVQRQPSIEASWQEFANVGLFGTDGRFQRGIGGDTFNYILQWAWEHVVGKEKGPIWFTHSDVFLIEPIKLTDYLQEHSLCSIIRRQPSAIYPESTVNYLWEAFLLANMSKLPSPDTENLVWWPSTVEGIWTDTGGRTHTYLKAHPEIKVLDVFQSGCEDESGLDFHPARYQFFHLGGWPDEPGSKRIFHYMSGSRWCTDMPQYWNLSKEQSDEYHAKKLAWTRKLINL